MRGLLALLLGAALAWGIIHVAWPRDLGQWEESSPEQRAWFRSLVQPDNLLSCCGDADGYYADEYHIDEHGNLIAVITDDRDDEPLQRVHVPIGTRYVVPANKVVDATKQRGNPTGHTIVFLGAIYGGDITTRPILCWVGGGGF